MELKELLMEHCELCVNLSALCGKNYNLKVRKDQATKNSKNKLKL